VLGAVFCSAVELELSPNYATHTHTAIAGEREGQPSGGKRGRAV